MIERWKQKARRLKIETYALYLAYQDCRVPWHARLVAIGVVAYAFSPLDLIPDFIPVLGYLDDLVLLPLGIMLALRLIPPSVLAECRVKAEMVMAQDRPANWTAAAVIIIIWLAGAVWSAVIVIRIVRHYL